MVPNKTNINLTIVKCNNRCIKIISHVKYLVEDSKIFNYKCQRDHLVKHVEYKTNMY